MGLLKATFNTRSFDSCNNGRLGFRAASDCVTAASRSNGPGASWYPWAGALSLFGIVGDGLSSTALREELGVFRLPSENLIHTSPPGLPKSSSALLLPLPPPISGAVSFTRRPTSLAGTIWCCCCFPESSVIDFWCIGIGLLSSESLPAI